MMSKQKVPWSVEQHIVIKFLIGENVPSAEIHHRLQQQYGEECLSRTHVFEWYLLATDVKEKIRSKRKTGGKRVAFLQDNARPHTAKPTMETLRKLKWNLLTHPPYSPDLAPSDFYLFGRLKLDLQGMRIVDNDAVIQAVRIRRQPQIFF
ncbi:hypothetical protein B7P43_G04338 [Cryptotermes secundus]|uniref:Mos1 transposase HTH domain-containing protein n=1 Tax=Cryptotermes secundus TaxID=105785 RepID=A0A2J7QW84_9NEOP|nr:hypothetical protein B7P43_G04338 [Cryptotermes secundus]